MLEPSDRNFGLTITNMLKELVGKWIAYKNRWRISAEMKTIQELSGDVKKNNKISQMNSFDRLSTKQLRNKSVNLEIGKKRLTKLKHKEKKKQGKERTEHPREFSQINE